MRAASEFTIGEWNPDGREVTIETGTPVAGAFITRHFTGGGQIEGSSQVVFTGAFSEQLRSGSYVAIDAFEGSILGRRGSCAFWHASTMNRGRTSTADGILRIVPDSGTGELTGITGTGEIHAEDGKHELILEIAFNPPAGEYDGEIIAESAGEVEGSQPPEATQPE